MPHHVMVAGMGSVIARLLPSKNKAFSSFVATRGTLENGGGNQHYPGLGPGLLGGSYAPTILESRNLHKSNFQFDGIGSTAGLSMKQWDQRRRLLDDFNTSQEYLGVDPAVKSYQTYFQRAFSLITSPEARSALDLSKEPEQMRRRYGMTLYGQHLLLARRLVEAGVKLVTVYWNLMVPRLPINNQPLWDTHVKNFMYLKDLLLPSVDGPVTTLLDDLQERGLLDETLVVWMGEFGRSPGINAKGGRDHWGRAGSAVLAGGGIQGGLVYGSTDEKAAYPMNDPVMPGDMSATIFHALGIPPRSIIYDRVNRPHSNCRRIATEEALRRNVVL